MLSDLGQYTQSKDEVIVIADHFRSDHDHEVNVAQIFLNLAIMIVSDRGS